MRRVIIFLFDILVMSTVVFAGDINTDGKLKSTLASGAPLEVVSSSMVVNLNADMVDGVQGTDIYTKTEVDALIAAAVSTAVPKQFYLTETTVQGGSALGNCETGFHMASVWEILDVSNLQYASDLPAARVTTDAGQGPPAGWGWIRTGGNASTTQGTPGGGANCSGYTSSDSNHGGTWVGLPVDWSDPAGGISGGTAIPGSPWITVAKPCDLYWYVWCVED